MKRFIIYDDDCNLCRRVVRFIRKQDRKAIFNLIGQQWEEGRTLINEYSIAEKDTNSVIYITGKEYYLRSTAVLHILKDLGGYHRLLYVFIIVPRFLRDWIYRLVAALR